MSNYDDAPEAAEADLRRTSDALDKAQYDLTVAEEYAEKIEQENPQTPEEEAEVTQRMEIVQREIEGLSQDVASAEEHMINTIEYWGTPST
jgi:DNA-binding protein H-NS